MSGHDAKSYATNLSLFNRFNEALFQRAMATLELPAGARGVDVGCGVGSHSRRLAELVGANGQITGVDPNAAFLDIARDQNDAPHVNFTKGSLGDLPFDDDSLDFAWCADVLWPGPADKGFPVADGIDGLGEMTRVVRPGGTIALAYWTSQLLLPGHPVLEARLGQAYAEHYFGPMAPDGHPHMMRAAAWLREVGCEGVQSRSFLRDINAPLDEVEREGLRACVPMLWGPLSLDEELRRRLEDVAAATFDAPGYYGWVVYSLFSGRLLK